MNVLKYLSGPLAFILAQALLPFSPIQNQMLGVAFWMILWWVLQALPLGVTALLPILLLPAFGIMEIKPVAANYAHPIIYLFFGGFALGLALEKWKLHTFLALHILKRNGKNARRIIFGIMLASAGLSMWISNTAAALMMLPIALAIAKLLETRFETDRDYRKFSIAAMLSLAFACNVGGMATLIGTPPNLIFAALSEDALGISFGFADWFVMAFPLVVILFTLVYILMTRVVYRIPSKPLQGVAGLIEFELNILGKFNTTQARVSAVFGVTALMWIFKEPISSFSAMSWISDTSIAILGATALFIVPSSSKEPLLNWADLKSLPWEILLLFGGGIAIAEGFAVSGVVELLGDMASSSRGYPLLVSLILVVFTSVFLTEIISNVALVALLLPIIIYLPGVPAESGLLAIGLTFGASCAFMLPIATPPNAIVFSSQHLRMAHMVKAGLLINLLGTAIIALYLYFAGPLIFP